MKDYRPITLSPIISKLFEKDMFDQISAYMDNFDRGLGLKLPPPPPPPQQYTIPHDSSYPRTK